MRATRDMGQFWDGYVRQGGAVSAICYHATPEEFELLGERQAKFFLGLLRRLGRPDPSKVRVLDIGGGIGRVAKPLAPHVAEYHLLDVSAEMIAGAKEYLGDLVGSGKVRLHKNNGYALGPLPKESVEFAFCDLCWQHMDREVVVGYLNDLRRVLVEGGHCWFYVPAMSYPERFEEAMRGDWPANLRRWGFGDLAQVLVRLGYRILSADPDVIEAVIEKAAKLSQLRTEPKT